MLRHCDSELDALLTESVPPIDLERISAFRGVLAKHKRKADDVKMAEEEKLLAGIVACQLSLRPFLTRIVSL